jgi:acyl carrier protein
MILLDKAKNIIATKVHVSAQEIIIDSRIIKYVGTDSLYAVELVIAFEQRFNKEISEQKVEKLNTIGKIVILIAHKLKNNVLNRENFRRSQTNTFGEIFEE